MTNNIEDDLKKCLTLISPNWKMQDNLNDKSTNFIYSAKTLDQCLSLIEQNNVDKDYALHRWYNYMTSTYSEYIFCEFGAIHDPNEHNHDVDIYINGIPFDVKLTLYPAKLSDRPYNLNSREGKNDMIKWYYKNQSQESRKQLSNRIYIVCDGKDQNESLSMKCDFNTLRQKIGNFMNYVKTNGLNKVEITDNNKKFYLYSDIIYIKY